MKYCAPCRLRSKDDDETCSRCGGSLRSLGASSGQQAANSTKPRSDSRQTSNTATSGRSRVARSSNAGLESPRVARKQKTNNTDADESQQERQSGPAPADIQFQLAGLQNTVQSSSRRVHLLAALAGVLAVSFCGWLWYLRHSYIMQFAEVDQLEIVRSELHTGSALVRFRPLTAGRIQFVREGAGRQETLLEHAAGPAPEGEFKEFHWTGDSSGAWSISIRYREGTKLVDRDWQSVDSQPGTAGVLAATTL